MKVIEESTYCPVCNTNCFQNLFEAVDLINNLPGKYHLVKCKSCDLILTNPRPNAASMSFYYPDNYLPYLLTDTQYAGKDNKNSILRKLLNLIFPHSYSLMEAIPNVKFNRALEIGCASGSYLEKLKNVCNQVEGIEYSTSASNKARERGLTVHNCSLEDFDPCGKKYDLIVGWMVLEHLHKPFECLAKLHECLENDGILVLSTPNCGYFGFKLFKEYEYGIHIPNHLYHFTRRSTSKLFDKAGFKIVRSFEQRTLGSIAGSFANVLRYKYNIDNVFTQRLANFDANYKIVNYLLSPLVLLLSYFQQTGRMTLWVQKK